MINIIDTILLKVSSGDLSTSIAKMHSASYRMSWFEEIAWFTLVFEPVAVSKCLGLLCTSNYVYCLKLLGLLTIFVYIALHLIFEII